MSSEPLRNDPLQREKLLRIRTSLKGRPLRTYAFRKEVITVGRNPEADVFLDNPGISRDHLRIELTPEGLYAVQDLGSANGTLLNEAPVQRQTLSENDVLRIGKYSLWISYQEDRRGDAATARNIAPDANDGTVVLSAAELEAMMQRSRLSEVPARSASVPDTFDTEALPLPPSGPSNQGWREYLSSSAILSFLAGTIFGATVLYVLGFVLKR